MGQDIPGGDETTEGADDDIDLGDIDGDIDEVPDDLKVTQHSIMERENGVAVVGTVKNKGDEAYDYVEVEVTLNDGDTVLGEWVDTSEQEIDDLAGGESWRFLATFDDEELTKATGYTISLDVDTM